MKRFRLLFVNGFTLCDRLYVQAKNQDVPRPRKMTTGKRTDYLSWNDYFMGIALLAAQRSKDPDTQVGACIVSKDKRIVGIGYNSMPRGCSFDLPRTEGEFQGPDQDEAHRVCDQDQSQHPQNLLNSKYGYVCHAEMNAVICKNTADLQGCTMYVSLFPCIECAKIIIQSGIKRIVYLSDKYADREEIKVAKILLSRAHVKYKQYKPHQDKITINLRDFYNENQAVGVNHPLCENQAAGENQPAGENQAQM